jgi:hypothetical protein
VDKQEDNATCELRFREHPPLIQQEVQVETVLLSVHSGIATLKTVLEADEEELLESMVDEIDADTFTLVLRERSKAEQGHPSETGRRNRSWQALRALQLCR